MKIANKRLLDRDLRVNSIDTDRYHDDERPAGLPNAGVTNCKEAAAQGCRINIINLLQCRKFIIFAAVQKIYNFGQRAKIEALLFLMWVLFYAHD